MFIIAIPAKDKQTVEDFVPDEHAFTCLALRCRNFEFQQLIVEIQHHLFQLHFIIIQLWYALHLYLQRNNHLYH